MNAEHEGKEAAENFRLQHKLENQPLGDLIALIEQTTGHDVAVLDVDRDEHGLTMTDPARNVTFIGIARTRNPMRQRSTLAHELAHVLFKDRQSTNNLGARSHAEIRADAFARHLLTPEKGLTQFLGNKKELSDSDLSSVVQHFLVSPALATIVIHSTGYISDSTKKRWMQISTPQLATRFGWNDQYQALQNSSDCPRPPQRLLARAIEGYTEGVVSLQTLATLRDTTIEVVQEDIASAGITPQHIAIPQMDANDLPSTSIDWDDIYGNGIPKGSVQ
ncbi:MAG: ImmA/IrrE family metallo-endopeptidase [Actinomyces sp.]|nr:ImmA/IrrE family metallo-endopeptidase [Actinomyces sp.]